MNLPSTLIDEIRKVGIAQKVDVDEAIRSVSVLVGADECISYRVWGGPGFGQEEVLLDIYVLGGNALYCYTVLTTHVVGTCHFLDQISSVGIVSVPDSRSPYILVMRSASSTEHSRVFGNSEDLPNLERFRAAIILERLRNREKDHAQLSD